jgi:hypothetical protein
MINGIRDRVVQLACMRHGLPEAQGRGADDLPPDLKELLKGTLPQTTEDAELHRSFVAVLELLVVEARHIDPRERNHLSTY